MVKVVIGTKVCSFEELLEEYGKICKENEKREECLKHYANIIDKQQQQIHDLEKENEVLKRTNQVLIDKEMENSKIFEIYDEEPLPFSDEQYEEDLIAELEDRHQQDCITINQLHTTIDTLVDRYAKLREMKGL